MRESPKTKWDTAGNPPQTPKSSVATSSNAAVPQDISRLSLPVSRGDGQTQQSEKAMADRGLTTPAHFGAGRSSSSNDARPSLVLVEAAAVVRIKALDRHGLDLRSSGLRLRRLIGGGGDLQRSRRGRMRRMLRRFAIVLSAAAKQFGQPHKLFQKISAINVIVVFVAAYTRL